MSTAANIVVKKHDGTTDITYTVISRSGGDNLPALWKSQTVGSAYAHQPELRVTSREAKNGAGRELRATYVYPQIATDTTTGVTSVVKTAMGAFSFMLEKTMTQADINEASTQFANLCASALMREMARTGTGAV